MDKYRIESQKLIYHPRRVADWLEGENIAPLYLEIGPVGSCIHRCIYCAYDYAKYKGPMLSEIYMKILLQQAAEIGVKSVVFAGEGEPYMHPSISAVIAWAKAHGLDVGVSTNGVLLDERGHLGNSLPFLDWIRFSVDAATEETYRKIHRCPRTHYRRVLENIRQAVEIKRRSNLKCTIGVQALLLRENMDEMIALTDMARGWGIDYFTIKPYSKHPLSESSVDVNYNDVLYLGKELENFSTENFSVIFRGHSMEKLREERPYKKCLGLPFITHVAANGDVYVCSRFFGDKDFVYGNIFQDCFPNIWEGEQRQKVLKRIDEMGLSSCREICHMDEINRYLWQLKNPPEHVNFI